jgi:HlyD family secretion protein
MKKFLFRSLIAVMVLGALGYAAWLVYQQLPQRESQIATTQTRKGDVVVRTFTRGELRAVRSATLSAPNLFGNVQVTKLAALGAFAREKDLVVEFDDAEVLSRLEERQLEVDQIDEQLRKSRADLAIRTSQDDVELLRARYSVRRAELEVRRNELISTIDARKNQLTLEESQRRLKQLESDILSRREQAEAEIAVLQERRNKAQLELARENQRLAQVKLLAPISGLVAVKQNRSSVTMFGMQLPDIREGDQVQPGMPVAEVLDLSDLEVIAKVGELDRANLRDGQPVNMRLDALPEKIFHGAIRNLSGTASVNMFSGDPSKKFDVVFSVDMKELLSILGAKPEAVQKLLALSERNKGKAGLAPPPPMGPMAGPTNGEARKTGEGRKGGETRKGGEGQGSRGRGNRGGGGPMEIKMPTTFNLNGLIVTKAELDNAKLPPPPEEDNQLDVLLRPGLLTDIEIIVEKLSNVTYVPIQALFERDGKTVVFVRSGSRFERKEVKPLRRSESLMVIAEGALKPGETIAMADPEAKPGDTKKKKTEDGGGAAGALPGGKS